MDEDIEINHFIFFENNFLANALNCNNCNYKEIIDRYFFIGFVDKFEELLDKLATIVNVKKYKIVRKNISTNKFNISNDIKELFYKSNELDYKLYNYAKSRFITND